MILEAAVVSLTRKLDLLISKDPKDGEKISSNSKLKEEVLDCLANLIDKAPLSEYQKLFSSDNYEILLGYLLSILCNITKNDKSNNIRLKALKLTDLILTRLQSLHSQELISQCTLKIVVTSLPGVTSTLYRFLMSDTKLPRNILSAGVMVLRRMISASFSECDHHDKKSGSLVISDDDLENVCDNLAVRTNFLIDYVLNHDNDLPFEMKEEILDLCHNIVSETHVDFFSKSFKSIIKYVAFISSLGRKVGAETSLKVMLIGDNIREQLQNCDTRCEKLEYVILTTMKELLTNLDGDCLTMLISERESELSILSGLLRWLPNEHLRLFLEIQDNRKLLLGALEQLVEYSTNQPFLFLTESEVNDAAIEKSHESIYTIEKRFTHLNLREVNILTDCCAIIGRNLDWLLLDNIITHELHRSFTPSSLTVTHWLLKGCLGRHGIESSMLRFTSRMIEAYTELVADGIDKLGRHWETEETFMSQDVITLVVAIETIVTLIGLHIKSSPSDGAKIVILKNLLCPLLNWASIGNRAISQASLSALGQISNLYGKDSTKSMIECNIDYIVDGVSRMLDSFVNNLEVTNVLALTLKLSSIDSFYYFEDVFEKVFRLLGTHYHTERSRTIALLFYRTLSIVSDWKDAEEPKDSCQSPLDTKEGIKKILDDISIDRRLKKLQDDVAAFKRIANMDTVTEDDVMREITSGKAESVQDQSRTEETHQSETKVDENNKGTKRPKYVILTERILKLCVHLISSNFMDTKILSLKAASCGLSVLRDDEDTLLPLAHQLWAPLARRLTADYKSQNLEVNLSAFECLVSMAVHAKDFIKRRTLDSIIPRICLFLETSASQSLGQKDYGPYCMTQAYKCQLKVLSNIGPLSFHIQLAYSSLWRVIKASLIYMHHNQAPTLRLAARKSLDYLIALDPDCVWYFAKESGHLSELPFELIYQS